MTPEEIAREIVKRELATYYVWPRPDAEAFDIYEAIEKALKSYAESEVCDERYRLMLRDRTPETMLVQDHDTDLLCAPKGHVLDDAGNVIAGEWKTWASIVEDVRTTHTAFIPTDQTAAAAHTPEAPDAREGKR